MCMCRKPNFWGVNVTLRKWTVEPFQRPSVLLGVTSRFKTAIKGHAWIEAEICVSGFVVQERVKVEVVEYIRSFHVAEIKVHVRELHPRLVCNRRRKHRHSCYSHHCHRDYQRDRRQRKGLVGSAAATWHSEHLVGAGHSSGRNLV